MSVCAIPAKGTKTDYTTPGSATNAPVDGHLSFCSPGTTNVPTPGGVVTQTKCCNEQLPASSGIILKDNGNVLGSVLTLDITGSGIKAYNSGTNGQIDGSGMVWRNTWLAMTPYVKNDVVLVQDTGDVFVCKTDHTSDGTAPTKAGHPNWEIMVDGQVINDSDINNFTPEDKSLWGMIKNGVMDWFKNATIGDWFKLLMTGAGIIYTGVKLIDAMTNDGSNNGSGNPADARFNGTNGTPYSSYTAPNLQTVVGSLLTFGGITSYDVSLLPTTSVEFIIGSQITVRNLLQTLSLVYQFDIIPSGTTVRCIPKNTAVSRVLTVNDIGHIEQSDGVGYSSHYNARRIQGIDLPKSVTLTYVSKTLNYNTYTQTATLETYTSGQDIKIDIPLVLSDDTALKVAQYALVNAHMERQEYTFTTDYFNLDLEPGDIVTIPLDSGVTTDVRLVTINETTDGLLEMIGVRCDYNSHTWAVSGITSEAPPSQINQVLDIGYSQALFLEVPPLSSSDTEPRMYMAIHGYAKENWPGANLYKSTDGGANYNYVMTSYSKPIFGQTSGTLGSHSDYTSFDTTNTITVTLKQGTLTSSTDASVQAGENWCMIGEELIGFVNATLTGTNTYQLSRLLRGRQGSEVHMSTHQANELFVLIDENLAAYTYPKNEIGKTVKFKVVTLGSDISLVNSEDVQPYGLQYRPWKLLTKSAVKQGNGDWLISWTERPKFNPDIRDFSQIPHDFDWGGVGIQILDNTDVTKRSYLTGDSSFLYTVAMQTTDFGSAQNTLKVTLSQVSQLVGSGYPVTFTA